MDTRWKEKWTKYPGVSMFFSDGPAIYKQKKTAPAEGDWDVGNFLVDALNAINQDGIAIGEATRRFRIPKTTLFEDCKRTMSRKKRLVPDSSQGEDTEKKLVQHILKLQQSGFAPTRGEVRITAKTWQKI
ncbi:hypothetical protein HHI36_008739 [Cryptolaemus montrouzieri]|uniref:HTH psq-type domain-containing protein n=1 Tax=Cryptolaemus montrouzieri TaxID=559131 RepID=A0ABD2MTB0_9CUCU